MKKKKLKDAEKISIIIASGTDAREKSKVISITRIKLVVIIAGFVLLFISLAAVIIFSTLKTDSYSRQAEELNRKFEFHSTYSPVESR